MIMNSCGILGRTLKKRIHVVQLYNSDWGARGTDRLDKTVDVQLNQPVPLLLILEKDGVHDGQLSMEVNDLMQSLEHPERVDADRALLITVKLR